VVFAQEKGKMVIAVELINRFETHFLRYGPVPGIKLSGKNRES